MPVVRASRPKWIDYLRSAATIYMTITGITYNLLLSNQEVDVSADWVNLVLYYITPIVMIIDWLIDTYPRSISASSKR